MDLQKIDLNNWQAPELSPDMPHGDMPGDKIKIDDGHIQKATTIFPLLIKELKKENKDKVVVSVFGGSGVGKSEIASLLTYYLQDIGIGAYVLSGDNYPRRIPLYNDAERFSIFRAAGLRGLLKDKLYSKDVQTVLDELWKSETDPDPKQVAAYPWLASYQKAGRSALKGYLGTEKEQDYEEINEIIDAANGTGASIKKKEDVHKMAEAIDIPILLNSTPEETREHRRLRARDGKTDSAFTTMVLEIEQEELDDRAPYAKIIIAKSGEVLDPQSFRKD